MVDAQVLAVRRFNRTVTQRLGALDDRYLSRARPLGQARVLWEVGPDGRDVRDLRARLDLDSGYLSRLLRSLEADGMVVVGPGEPDRRVRRARLTRRGEREWRVLDRSSDELAASFLAPLSPDQRDRLTTAMAEVERLLTASLVQVAEVDPRTPEAQHCLAAYAAELDSRFDAGFDVDRSRPIDDDEVRRPGGAFLVATLHGEPIGCCGLKLHGDRPAEIKRLWVSPDARGLGLGRRLLQEVEALARDAGHAAVQLDTNRSLTEAIALYRSAGYREIPAFNDEPYAHHWFEKDLC
jgi:DNA-binding MarR family transcriptional regulator/N-acetylglutamate synthase-like GNAT family acetyltransferase